MIDKNFDVHLGEKGTQKAKKVYEYHFHLESDSYYDFQVAWALLEDFEIFYNFDHILLPYFWAFFNTSKWVWLRWLNIWIANSSI